MTTGDATTLLTTQLGAAGAAAYLMNALQRWKQIPWITAHTNQINFAIRLGLSGATALGISHVWAPTDGGGGVLTIAIPPLVVMIHGIWHWFCQYVLTHGFGSIIEKTKNVETPSSIEVPSK